MKLKTQFSLLIDHNPAPLDDMKNIVVVGDAHASFAIWFIPLIQLGYISLAKDQPRTIRLQYLQRLDEITQSTYIDQLRIAGDELDKLRQSPDKLINTVDISDNIPFKLAHDQFKRLEQCVQKERDDFTNIMHTLTLEKKCKLVDMGDSTGDRGYCDLYMIQSCALLMDLGVEFGSLFANHTLETLYTILTDTWDLYEAALMERTIPSLIRSLLNFKTLVQYGLVSTEERNHLLSRWMENIHLITCSYANEDESETAIYTHAPVNLSDIVYLARKYCQFSRQNPILSQLLLYERHSIEYHRGVRALVQAINAYFRANFFTQATGRELKDLILQSRILTAMLKSMRTSNEDAGVLQENYRKQDGALRQMPLWALVTFVLPRLIPEQRDLPATFHFYHAHTSEYLNQKDNTIPSNLISLDNNYFKATDYYPAEYIFSNIVCLTMHELLNQPTQSMANGTLYYAHYSTFVAFKGASIDCVVDANKSGNFSVNFSLLTPLYISGTTIDVKLTRSPLNLWGASHPDFPKFIRTQVFYSDEYGMDTKKETNVPLLRKKQTETFDNFFDPIPINSDLLTAIDEPLTLESLKLAI